MIIVFHFFQYRPPLPHTWPSQLMLGWRWLLNIIKAFAVVHDFHTGHLRGLAINAQQYLQQHYSSSIPGNSCLCRSHSIEAQRNSNYPQHPPTWKKAKKKRIWSRQGHWSSSQFRAIEEYWLASASHSCHSESVCFKPYSTDFKFPG